MPKHLSQTLFILDSFSLVSHASDRKQASLCFNNISIRKKWLPTLDTVYFRQRLNRDQFDRASACGRRDYRAERSHLHAPLISNQLLGSTSG